MSFSDLLKEKREKMQLEFDFGKKYEFNQGLQKKVIFYVGENNQ